MYRADLRRRRTALHASCLVGRHWRVVHPLAHRVRALGAPRIVVVGQEDYEARWVLARRVKEDFDVLFFSANAMVRC